MKKYDTARHAIADNIIRCMRSACWKTKATLRISNNVLLPNATEIIRTHLSVTYI